jgi:hypothetical protein
LSIVQVRLEMVTTPKARNAGHRKVQFGRLRRRQGGVVDAEE